MTIAKIQSLILEQKQIDDKALYEKILNEEPIESLPSEIYNVENRFPEVVSEYIPLRYDAGDTQKLPTFTKEQYEEFLDDMEEQLIRDIEINEGPEKLMSGASGAVEEEVLPEEAAEEGAVEDGKNKDDQDGYNEFISNIKSEMMKTTLGTEGDKLAFKFDRVTDDIFGFRERIATEREEINKGLRTAYDDDDVDMYNEEHIDKLIAHQQFDKEDEKEFDETFSSLTADIYSNLREDMKNQYDQARLMMKLNQQLRIKILYSLKNNKQMLT